MSDIGFIMEKNNISGSDALDMIRTGYRVYLKDGKSGFKWEKLVTESAMQKKIMDV